MFNRLAPYNCSVAIFTATLLICSPIPASTQPHVYSICQHSNSDSDGDGWGWENNKSCIVANTGSIPNAAPNPEICSTGATDTDGDGWGWENNKSCVVANGGLNGNPVSAHQTCSTTSSDPDGDSWGFENGQSCLVRFSKANQIPYCQYVVYQGAEFGRENNQQCIAYKGNDITDLILITGQSNVLGKGTTIDPATDTSHPRVFAYTSNGWQVASLAHNWDIGAYRGTADPATLKDQPTHNNFALHFGKRLVALDSKRVVGIVMVSEPGEGISHWDPGAPGMARIQTKVADAINEIPHKTSIDGILWHQGETDWLYNGTADPDITPPVRNDYYPVMLSQLISNLRSENWYDKNKPFICGETIGATGVNRHLNALNTDSDPMTACVEGFGLAATNSHGGHFNADSLRTIGARYAERYFSITN